jgi:hypothetical protein
MVGLTISVLMLWLILDIAEDFGYITSNSKLWHMADAVTRVLIMGYVAFLNFGLSKEAVVVTGLSLSFYWIVFDMALNKARKLSLFYVGSGSIDLAVKWVAKKLGADHEFLMILIKGVAFTTFSYLTIRYLI